MSNSWGNSWGRAWGNSWGVIAAAVAKGYPTLHITRKRKRQKSLEEDREEIRQAIALAFDPPVPEIQEQPVPPVAAIDLLPFYHARLASIDAELRARDDEEAMILLLAS